MTSRNGLLERCKRNGFGIQASVFWRQIGALMSRPEASSGSNASTNDAHGEDDAWREAAALGEVGSTYYGLTRNGMAQRLPESAVSGRVDLGERGKSRRGHGPGEAPGSPFLSVRQKTVQSRPWFLVSPRIWAFIHPASSCHPRSPGAHSGTLNKRKARTGPLCRRENTRTLLPGHKSPFSSLRCSAAAVTTPRQSAGRLP
jgi:hypothetical protein